MKRKGLIIPFAVLVVIATAYLLGPKMPKPEFNSILPTQITEPLLAEEMILAGEAGITNIKKGNQSLLVWQNDSLKMRTDYCLLYLHGFSASPVEGNPVHINFAKKFGMNLYAPRLAEHGLITEDALLNMTPDILWKSAKNALVLAHALGKKVVIMGTSTGGTLALSLAAEFPDMVDGLVLFSPNIRIYDKSAVLLAKPWGLQIARAVLGGDYRVLEPDPETDPYWYNKYRVESIVYLQQLVESTMTTKVFAKVTQPVYVGYYYKDEENQDNTVSTKAIEWMFEQLGTPNENKLLVSFPDAGDHVICNNLTSESWEDVQKSAIDFAERIIEIDY